MRAGRALVIGGSMGGLFTALLLRRHGWEVCVFERAGEPLSGRGAGIVTHPELWRIAQDAGLDPAAELGVRVTRRLTLDRDGTVVGTLHCLQTMTSWDRLFRMLRAALPDESYAPGKDVRAIEQDGRRVAARFADGSSVEGDLLVGADGLRSAVREQIAGDVPLIYAGYVAWRGLIAEVEVPEPARSAIFADFAFCLPPGEQMLGYPVAGQGDDLRAGHRRYNFVWYRPADEAAELPNLLTDTAGRTHALSIPPPLIRPEIVDEMRGAASRILAPQFMQIVQATRQPFLQPIYDLQSPCVATGRVALAGDAAFVVRPHVGAGVTKAAEDAQALALALDQEDGVETALRRYEAVRLPAGQRVVQRARHLGAYMQAQRRTGEERRAAARHRTPEAVMAETAVLNF